MSTVPALQPSGSAGSVGRISWQDLKSQSSCSLTPISIYYLFNSFFLRWDMQNNTNLPFRVCLGRPNVCLSVGLPRRGALTINNKVGVRAELAAFSKLRAVWSVGSHERTRSPGSYQAGSLLEQCWSCSPTAIPEGTYPEASLANWKAARRQT